MARKVFYVRPGGRGPGGALNIVLGLALAAVLIAVVSGGHLRVPASLSHALARAHSSTSTAAVRLPAAAPAADAAKAIGYAKDQLGKPYVWGGPTRPGAGYGFDCSGLVQAAWAAAGIKIERTSEQQWASLPHVTRAQLKPGDLVFYHGYLDAATDEQPPGHVALYLGDGKMLEAYGVGVPVRITTLRPGAWGYAQVTTTN